MALHPFCYLSRVSNFTACLILSLLLTSMSFAAVKTSESQELGVYEFIIRHREFLQNQVIYPQATALNSRNHYNSFSDHLDKALALISKKQISLECGRWPERIKKLRQYLQLAFYEGQIFKKDFPDVALMNTLKIYILSHYFQVLGFFVEQNAEGGVSQILGHPLTCQYDNRQSFVWHLKIALEHLNNFVAQKQRLLTIQQNQIINDKVLPYLQKNLKHFQSQDRRRSFVAGAIGLTAGGLIGLGSKVVGLTVGAGYGLIVARDMTRLRSDKSGSSQIPLQLDELLTSIDFLTQAGHPYEFYIGYFRLTLGLQKNSQELIEQIRLRFNNDFEQALIFLDKKKGESHD